MPIVTLPLPESDQSITRPVVFDILREVLRVTNLSPKTPILFPNTAGEVMLPGSDKSKENTPNQFGTDDRLWVEISETYIDEQMPSTITHQPEYLPVWRNDALEVVIKPIYVHTEVKISIRYRAKDKTAGKKWRDQIRTRTPGREDVRLHDIKFHHGFAEEHLYILKEIHRLQENIEGYGEDFNTFFQKSASNRITVLTDPGGKNATWVIPEAQTRVLGFFDFDDVPPEGEKEDGTDTWVTSFSYTFRFDKPITAIMTYPVMIHNQVLSTKYRNNESFQVMENNLLARTSYLDALKSFEAGHQVPDFYWQPAGRQIPTYDEWLPRSIVTPTIRLFTALVGIDPVNPNLLFSINDLASQKIELDADVKAFMKKEAPFMNRHLKSVFSLTLYTGRILQDWGRIRMDSNLDIYSVTPLSMRQYHHIRLALVTDWSLLDKEAIDRIKENAVVVDKLLEYILPPVIKPPTIKPLGPYPGYIPTKDIQVIKDVLKETYPYIDIKPAPGTYNFLRVQVANIIARHPSYFK